MYCFPSLIEWVYLSLTDYVGIELWKHILMTEFFNSNVFWSKTVRTLKLLYLSLYLYNILENKVIIFRFSVAFPCKRHFSKDNSYELKILKHLVTGQLLCFKVTHLIGKSFLLSGLDKSSASFLLNSKNESRNPQTFRLTLLEVRYDFFKFFVHKSNFSKDSKTFKN